MGGVVTRVSHGFRRRGLDLSPRAVGVLISLVVLILCLIVLRLFLVTRVVVSARNLQQMRVEYMGVQQENAKLEELLAHEQSVVALMGRAQDMDLMLPEQIVVIER